MKTGMVARAMAVLAFVPVGPVHGGSPATVTWDRDVAPALGSVICMMRYEHKGKVNFTPTFKGCEAPAGLSPAMLAVRQVFAGSVQTIERLRSTERATEGAFRDVPEGTPDRNDVLLARFRHDLLASPRFQKLVMPGVHQALAEAGLTCADCPGPRTQPPVRPVTVAALVPYAVAFYWPDGIRPDGGVNFHICVGINGLATDARSGPGAGRCGRCRHVRQHAGDPDGNSTGVHATEVLAGQHACGRRMAAAGVPLSSTKIGASSPAS